MMVVLLVAEVVVVEAAVVVVIASRLWLRWLVASRAMNTLVYLMH